MANKAFGNIRRVEAINVALNGDFEPEHAEFFIRAEVTGAIRYCPVGNADNQYITKNFTGSNIFVDPEQCRKIFKAGTTATNIFVGYGV